MMCKVRILLLFIIPLMGVQADQTWAECVVEDVSDTLSTGVPVALAAAAVWAIANHIPHDWQDLEGPAADFIYTTWQEQGFKRPYSVLLKKIPPSSVLSRLVVYTQELPGALAVGNQFVERITQLLEEKELFKKQLSTEQNPLKQAHLKETLKKIEEGLDECRFVCGHERVHKEKRHTYQLLTTQFLAPFVVYSFLKYMRTLLAKQYPNSYLHSWIMQTGPVRTSLELLIGWLRTRQFEYQADIYASQDPKILRAGLRMFKRALRKKLTKLPTHPKELAEIAIGWILQYTHPTLPERVYYLERYIKRLEKKKRCSAF